MRTTKLDHAIRLTAFTGVASIVLLASGCGSTPTAGHPAAAALPSPSSASATPSTTTAPSSSSAVTSARPATGVGPTADFTSSITDADGYKFDLVVTLVTTDLGDTVEFDKPGFMSAYFTLSLSIDLVNRTPGRTITFESVPGVTAPLSNPKFLLAASWDTGSPVCTAVAITDSACAMVLGFGYVPGPLAAGTTVGLDIKKGRPGGWFTAGLAAFPESAWPTVKPALAAPSRYLISYDGGGITRFDCNLNSQLGVLIAASKGAFDCADVDVQAVSQPETP